MSNYWSGKRVFVTGGSGFIGQHLVPKLIQGGSTVTAATRNRSRVERLPMGRLVHLQLVELDLQEVSGTAEAMARHDVLLHLAATVGGIEFNMKHPASIFRENSLVNLGVLEAARLARVPRVLLCSSACVYPRHCQIPTPEEDGFQGQPEPTNQGYGWAKRMLEYAGKAYAEEFGMSVSAARPYNCYGPGDNFDPQKSHVIPALIRRVWKDRERPLRVWGSGKQSRSFLYVDDFAEGLLLAAEKCPVGEVVNLGSKEETPIAHLVGLLQKIHQDGRGEPFEAEFDVSKPDGQPRRCCDVTRAGQWLGFESKWSLEKGLQATVDWYLKQGMP